MESDHTLSGMETHHANNPTPRPSREDADAALRESEHLRSQFQDRPVPVPAWYFPALALYLAGISLAQTLPNLYAIGITILIAAAIGFSVGVVCRSVGYIPKVGLRQILPCMIPILALFIGALVLDHGYDKQWGWYVAAGVSAAFMLILGYYYHRATRAQSS